jgi:hypothetical protein
MLQCYVLTCGRSVTAFLAPPRSQRTGQGPRSPHPRPALGMPVVEETSLKLTKAASVVQWLACCPLVPKIVGSNPAEDVGFFERKNPQHAFLRRGNKAVCSLSQLCGRLKNPTMTWKSHLLG